MRSKVTARGPEALGRTASITSFRTADGRFQMVRPNIENESGRCPMRNHDPVSDGFLALTAGGLVLLCSSLVALAFA